MSDLTAAKANAVSASALPASAAQAAPPRQPGFRTLALVVASAMFMEQLDATVLATALPTMARQFGVAPPAMSVALTGYLLSLAVFIPASGRIADRFGSRTVFAAAIAIFTLGSILCAQAPTLGFLVAARVIQGLGGAMMVPVGRLVLLKSIPRSELVAAMSWLLVPALIGPILGPPIGGLIVSTLDWRWIFYINVPFGVVGMVLVLTLFDNIREERPASADFWGFLLSGVSLACLLFGFESSSRGEASPLQAVALIGIGVVSGALYIRHAQRHPAPILDLKLMRVQTFGLSVIAGSLSRITQGAQPFLLPLMMQVAFGLSAAESGFLTVATAIGSMAMKAAGTPILRRFGFRTTLIWNSLFSSLLYAVCAAFRPDWPHALLFAVMMLAGFSMSLQFTAYNTIAYAELDRRDMSQATAFYTTFQQLMLSLGIAAGAAALHASVVLTGHAHPQPSDFSVAFLVVTAISLLASPINARLPRNAGAEMTGQRRVPEVRPAPEKAAASLAADQTE